MTTIITNRKARRDYTILDTMETGIELKGTEVKSLRNKKGNLSDSFAKIENGQVFIFNLHISPYEFGNRNNHDPLRTRRLLLHKSEIRKLFGQTSIKGHSLIPLKLYFKKGKVKVELSIAEGKTKFDKRETIRKKEDLLKMQRAKKRAYQGKN
ncbi:MAG: SsrA-binding protein SmpB [Candidatus Aureabacteria bacterium]|nr:SsrA-binding protein SmpB [Candidatus Auribacterota bacterium]